LFLLSIIITAFYNLSIISNSLIYLVVSDDDLDGDEAEVVSLNEIPLQSVALKSPQPTTTEVKARSALKSGAKRIKIEESDNGSALSLVSNNTTSAAVMKPAARSMFSPTRLKGKPATRVPVPLR
jgi:hypothetical protein